MEKWCSYKKHSVPTSEFNERLGQLQPYCRECQKLSSRQYYKRNRRLHIKNVKRNNRSRQQAFNVWKQTLHCQSCQEHYWKCLDFHHLDPTKKDIVISGGAYRIGRARLLAELEKCVVLCKNCHTKVHDGVIVLANNIETCVEKFGSIV